MPPNGVWAGQPSSDARGGVVRDQLQLMEQQVAAMQNEMMTLNQGLHPHIPNHPPDQVPGSIPPGASQPPFPLPPSFQQIIAQQQQARAAAGLQGLTGSEGTRGSDAGAIQPAGATHVPQDGSGHDHNRQRGPGGSREFSSEGVGPGGQRWQIRVNETTMVMPTATQFGAEGRAPQRLPIPHGPPPDLFARHHNPIPTRFTPSPTVRAPISTVVSSQTSTYDPILSTVYLLSSPNGPVGLVLHPQASYAHTPVVPIIPQYPQYLNHSHPFPAPPSVAPRMPGRIQAPGANYFGPRQRPFNPPPINPPPMPEPPAAPVNNDNNNQAMRDLARHLWLFIRLFGFVFFFTSGAGWRRTIILCLAAAIVFAVQTGWLGDVQESFLGPIRRHLEGLLPLAEGNAQPAAPTQQGRASNATTTPAEAAARLVRERQARNSSWLRERSRRVERALLIFAASLVPGVGERHIAARDAAEALRAASERERVERENREREEREGHEEVFTDAGEDPLREEGSANPLASGVANREQEHNEAVGAH